MNIVKAGKYIYSQRLTFAMLLAGCALVGCNKDDEPSAPTIPDSPEISAPTWTCVIEADCPECPNWDERYPQGEDECPQWQLPDLSFYPTSMAAVIRLPEKLEQYMGPDDELGAFINGECRGLAATDDANGTTLWFVVFKADDTTPQKVEFRYYNARLKRIYVADDGVKYETNGSYGNIVEPAVPAFENNLRMRGYVVIPSDLIGYSTVNDRLALFVGNECRAVGTLVNNGSYAIDAFLLPGEEFTFRYYNSRLKYLFQSNADEMTAGRELGISASPYKLDFMLSRCHPLKLTMTLCLPEALAANATDKDIVGVFVGDECRGVISYSDIMAVEVRASVTAESYVIRYYNASAGNCYRSREALPMPIEDAGDISNPLIPDLTKE